MPFPYQDPSRSVEERIADLLSRMTLSEKLSQLRLYRPTEAQARHIPFDTRLLEENRHCLGAVYNTCSMPPENIRIIQDWCLHNTRLGIPMAFHGESLHGVMHENATVFPQSIGMGATFNPHLMEQIASKIGAEARAHGIRLTYAPNIDLSRDPRWGRVEENFGEDPYLTSRMGVAYIKGLQSQGVAACPKHFIAHGSPEGGLNLAPVHAGQREFWETMAVPFQKAVTEAGAMAMMPAYSEWDGEPIHSCRRLLTGLLRERWGFTGPVISDYGAIKMLHSFQRVAPTVAQAGRMALEAGVDVEAPTPQGFGPELETAVREGQVSEELVDQAVARVLRHKFTLGLFEDPYPGDTSKIRGEEALSLALRAAEESIVLLKNEGGLLPLSSSVKKIALIGPNADNPQLGDYTVRQAVERTVSLRDALYQRLGEDRVSFARGCTTAGGTAQQLTEAVQAAAQAQLALVVLGDNSNFYAGIGWGNAELDGKAAVTCGEGFDTHTLELPGHQQRLLEAIHATGTPVVLLLQTGRPYSVCWAKAHIPAILQIWYPGEQGSLAVVRTLFGENNPSGRLPVSFPRSAGHIPCFYNHKVSARGFYKSPGTPQDPGRDYVFDTPEPLFCFGEGLSYTSFCYTDLKLPEKASAEHPVRVCVTVKNTGDRAGYEVVQLYITDLYCRITPFVRQLRGIQKLWLEPGQSKIAEFTLGFEDFCFINEQMQPEVEPGVFRIRIGDLQGDLLLE